MKLGDSYFIECVFYIGELQYVFMNMKSPTQRLVVLSVLYTRSIKPNNNFYAQLQCTNGTVNTVKGHI